MEVSLLNFWELRMGFCHRVASRLHIQAERLRRLRALPFLHPASCILHPIYQQRVFRERRKQQKVLNPFFTAFSFVCLLLALLCHLSKRDRTYFPLLVSILVTSYLGCVKTLDDFSKMDVSFLNCGHMSAIEWKTLASKVLSGTKKNLIKMEEVYLKMKTFPNLINQLVFFSLCERVFMLRQPVVSFYTLMFYNVIAYCVSYIKELIEREDWSMYVHVARGSNVRHLAMSATKIVLEWTKAVTFIITVVFILLVFGLEKGLKNYSPGVPYLVITGVYYISSEKVFADLICKILDWLKFECFENMENLYSPLILKGIQIGLSFLLTIICGLLGHVRITMLSCFTNIRIKYKEVDSDHWQPLIFELVRLMRYRCANREEILRHDDVCAICLQPMKTARVTPCRHFFHADCLRRCLKHSYQQVCPICKQNLPPIHAPLH